MSDLLPRERDLLKRIDENEDLRPLFFRKVRGLKWFDHLAERSYFEPDQNPAPTPADEEGYVRIPTWQVIDYLVKTAPELNAQDSLEYAGKFLSVIVSATNFAKQNDFGNYRTWWQFAEVLRQIPAAAISGNDLSVIDYWLDDRFDRGMVTREIGEKWLPSLLDSGGDHELALASQIIGLIYEVKFVDKDSAGPPKRDATLRIEHHYSERITSKVIRRAGERMGAGCVDIFDRQLERVLSDLKNDTWSSLWQPAIEDHDQNKYRDDAENIIVKAYRESLAGFMSVSANDAFAYVSKMLASDFETVRRIAIHTVNHNYRVCSELVSLLIDDQYLTENYRHEMWEFLNRNYGQMSRSEQDKVVELILGISRTDDEGDPHVTATAYAQANWLSALEGYGESEATLYQRKVTEAGVEPDHPSFSSFTSGGLVVYESPIPIDDLHGMEIDQLVQTLDDYRGDSENYGEPGIEGLSKSLRDVIKASPMEYALRLDRFVGCDLAYVHQIIEAYKDLWVERVRIPWNDVWHSLLKFCCSVVTTQEFWSEANTKPRSSFVANRYWVVSSISMLIEAGTKSDDNAFDSKHLKAAEDVLAILLEREVGEEYGEDSDAVSLAINSPRGRAIEALINMTLRCCRLENQANQKDHTEAWAHFEPFYEAELNRAEIPEYEFVTLVMNYLPNFLYMSREWVTANLDRILDRGDEIRWRSAMQGYLHISNVYQDIFEYLKKNGHFISALDDEHLKDRARERIVQNIGVAFRSDFEDLADEDSLIYKLLERGNHDELGQLVWLFWTMRKNEDPDLTAKVVSLWRLILDRTDALTLEDRRLVSKLCQWAIYIDEVNDGNRDLLLRVAPYADLAHNSYELLKSLAKISQSQPLEAQAIWMKILEGSTPDYPEEAIREILTNLVNIGADGVRKAKETVSVYLKVANEKPSIWLRDAMDSGSAEGGL